MKRMIFLIVTGILIMTVTQAQVINLNNSVKTTAKNAVPPEFLKEAKTARVFDINPALQSAQNVKIGDKVALQLFENQNYTAQISNITTDVNGTLALTLKLPEYPMGFAIIITSKEGKSLINVSIPELSQTFGSLYNALTNEYYMIEVDTNKRLPAPLDNDAVPIPEAIDVSGNASQLRSTRAADCGPDAFENPSANATIRLLVVYTPAAATSSYCTNKGGINVVIGNMIALGNLCLSNSLTDITLELAYSAQVDYVENNNMNTSLSRLQNPTDGDMDEVHTLRKQYGADLVQLLTTDDDSGGLGYTLSNTAGNCNYGFSVCWVTQVGDDYPCSVHELGHNMGLGHGAQHINNPATGIFSYSYGWTWNGTTSVNKGGTPTTKKGSVMTYWSGDNYADGIPCHNVPYFSNPGVSYEGGATGDAALADAARSLREMKHVIANYSERLLNLPDIPTNIVVSNPTDFGATFSWDACENVVEYRFCRPTGPNSYSWLTPTSSTPNRIVSYATWFQPGITYEFFIEAVNDCGDAVRSQTLTFTTAHPTDPTVVTLDASNISKNSATLNKTVTANGEAIVSEGFMYKTSSSSWMSSTTGNLTGLIPSTNYQFYAYATTASNTFNGKVLTFGTSSCDIADQFIYTIEMNSEYANGWFGSSLIIRQNGADIKTVTLEYGSSSGQSNVSLCACMPFELIWVKGNPISGTFYDFACSFTIKDNNNTQIFATPDGSVSDPTAGCGIYTTGEIVYSGTPDCIEIIWTPPSSSDDDWNVSTNWAPQRVPSAAADVIIPKTISYPILKTTDEAEAHSILFKPGAELGNQHLLDYQKAYVQLDFSPTPNPTTLSRNRWWMLTNPLQELYAGDFSFGGLPGMAIQRYGLASGEQGDWISLDYDDKLEAGDSFILWLTETDTEYPLVNKGLNASGGIITLPYFENPEEEDVHWTHHYDHANNDKSIFYGWNETGSGVFEPNLLSQTEVTRDLDVAYQLVNSAVFQKDLDFGLGDQGRYYYAATGNPFMSSISFAELQEDNQALISENYWVWVGAGADEAENPGSYAIYNISAGPLGTTSIDDVFPADYLSDAVPPMQSFIVEWVEKEIAPPEPATITFDIANISATGENTTGLRASTPSGDLLEIIASTPQSAVRAVVASREKGSLLFNRKDARKLFAGINSLPDIYMLKPAVDNRIVKVAANIVNEIEEDLVIPLGIATTYEGSISLSFAGMDAYNARIFLIDAASPDKKENELTGQSHFEYTFDYKPEKVNGTAVSNENRFFIRLSAMNPTSPETITPNRILVYSPKANTIQAVSGELMQQVSVFNIQGKKIYDNASVNAYEHTVAGLAPGVYLAKIVNTNEVKTAKIVVR